ncbi:MAG: bifunctional methylenetetrahydrofolate dehydrogenase/methenyltetrahydrofolate cyclohydrolase FolD [Candidatus Diapherotrites archaeon]
MPAKIIDGKALSAKIREELKKEVEELKAKGITPGLTVVQVGHVPASDLYVKMKTSAAAEVGIKDELVTLPETASFEELQEAVEKLNKDESVHGILVQLPLPDSMKKKRVAELIAPEKDVDGFHPYNHGKNLIKEPTFISATPRGIIELIQSTGEKIEGAHAVIVGTSSIVGKPTALMLLNLHATITMCNRYTVDLGSYTRQADILVVAVGKPNLITGDMVKEGAVVIDVGINKLESGKIVGDVDFEGAKERAGWITPVPGGVGPMTVAALLENTVLAAKRIHNVED